MPLDLLNNHVTGIQQSGDPGRVFTEMGFGIGIQIALGGTRSQAVAQFRQLAGRKIADGFGRRAVAQLIVGEINQAFHLFALEIPPQAAHERSAVRVSLGRINLSQLNPRGFINRF